MHLLFILFIYLLSRIWKSRDGGGGGNDGLVEPPDVGAQGVLRRALGGTVRALHVLKQLQVADPHVLGHVELVAAGVGAHRAAPQRVALPIVGLLEVPVHKLFV